MPSRFISCCLLLISLGYPRPGASQVIATLNEVAIGGTVEYIGVAPTPQFVGDRYVAFEGQASTSGFDLWVKDLTTPRGVIRSFDVHRGQDWALSPNGRHLAFLSNNPDFAADKTNLCWRIDRFGAPRRDPCFDLFLRDLVTGDVTRIIGPEGREVAADVGGAFRFSADGRWIVYQRAMAEDPRSQPMQVLLHDRQQGVTTRVSGEFFASSGSASRDASRVAFAAVLNAGTSAATLAVMAYDRATGFTERVDVDDPSLAPGSATGPVISADGRYVAFQGRCATCTGIIPSAVYVRDLLWKRTWRPIRALGGAEPDGGTEIRGLSETGRFILFESASRNLVENDLGFADVFMLDRVTNTVSRVSQSVNGDSPDGFSFAAAMGSDALRVVFTSSAGNLLPPSPGPFGHGLYLASLDLDNDRLHDSWERFFGVSPLLTDPAFDEDGDGLSNLQEFERQTHPRGRYGLSVQVPPEGEGWGIKLHNLGPRNATAVLRIKDAAGNAVAQALTLAPLSLTAIRLADLPDRPGTQFTLEVESDEPLFGLSRDWRP
jgi:Tol biopolymer transport system component